MICIAPFVMQNGIRSDIFTFFEIVHQDVRAVLHTEFGGIEDHMIIIHISPGPAGVLIVVGGAFLIICLDFFLRFVVA